MYNGLQEARIRKKGKRKGQMTDKVSLKSHQTASDANKSERIISVHFKVCRRVKAASQSAGDLPLSRHMCMFLYSVLSFLKLDTVMASGRSQGFFFFLVLRRCNLFARCPVTGGCHLICRISSSSMYRDRVAVNPQAMRDKILEDSMQYE